MKKRLSLLAIMMVSLTSALILGSCNKTIREGIVGPSGPQGIAGIDGKDGIDGSIWLTLEGVPSTSLGNNGDNYLNTLNGDVYLKENNKWILKMNIQGEEGIDGEDGQDGREGSSGTNGKDSYSSTIIPFSNSDKVIVSPTKDRAFVGETVTFDIKLLDSNNFIIEYIYINGTDFTLDTIDDSGTYSLKDNGDNTYTLSVKMVKGGFAIGVKLLPTSVNIDEYFKDNVIKQYIKDNIDDGDEVLSSEERNKVTNIGEENTAIKDVTNLNELAFFPNIEVLHLDGVSNVTSVDLSVFKNLKELYFGN